MGIKTIRLDKRGLFISCPLENCRDDHRDDRKVRDMSKVTSALDHSS